MKYLFVFICFIPSLVLADPGIDAIKNAIKEGNIDKLSTYFDSTLELCLEDQEDIYDKSEAILKVKNFFTSNKPNSFKMVHQGKSADTDAHYCIGTLSTDQGSFRVYLYMQKNQSDYIIQELRFDKE